MRAQRLFETRTSRNGGKQSETRNFQSNHFHRGLSDQTHRALEMVTSWR